jgi:2-polyprenyl-3-methyl-5-hydroxy-6-metoxy-1,4-benzoquinol methylase
MKRIDDNLEEYADPALYDYEHKDFEPYGSFYLALAERIGGEILEVGCGTGRITIPLAQRGFNITELEIVPEMLEFARRKAPELSIDWIKADVRDFQLNRKFDLIIEPGSAFQHMLENADQQVRFTFPQEMESLLAHCGFIISERYGDWDFSPLTNKSNYMIYLCKATGN